MLVIVGSTSSGKSSLAIELAKRYNGEIISADSRQVYKYLNAATGKVTKEEMLLVPHHLIDVVEPEEECNAHLFAERVYKIISEIRGRGKLPIIAGGTGFYIENILFEGVTSLVTADPDYREELSSKSIEELQEILKEKDEDAYLRIDVKNPRRLIRTLEVIRELGFFPMQKRIRRYDYIMVGIQHSRVHLKERIDKRLHERFEDIKKEISFLLGKGVSPVWLDNLGLESRHMVRMLTQNISEEDTKQNLLSAIFAYAKRQDVWWKRYPEINWYKENEFKNMRKFLDKIYL